MTPTAKLLSTAVGPTIAHLDAVKVEVAPLVGRFADEAVVRGEATPVLGARTPERTDVRPPRRLERLRPPADPADRKPKPSPEETLAKIERLGTEIPGMLRSVDDLTAEAIRRDVDDYERLRTMKLGKDGAPAEQVVALAKELEAARKQLLDVRGKALEAWQKKWQPYLTVPRQLRAESERVEALARAVKSLDAAYEKATKDDGWSGKDAQAYRARAVPQRKAAEEFAGIVDLLHESVLKAGVVHAGAFVVAHQQVTATINNLKRGNAATPGKDQYGTRIRNAAHALSVLADWLEAYLVDGAWKANVHAVGEQARRLVTATSNFPTDHWPKSTETTLPSTNPRSAVEEKRARDAAEEAARKAREEAERQLREHADAPQPTPATPPATGAAPTTPHRPDVPPIHQQLPPQSPSRPHPFEPARPIPAPGPRLENS